MSHLPILTFIAGTIVGMVAMALYLKSPEIAEAIEKQAEAELLKSEGAVKFVDPITPAEQFKKAEKIDDMIPE